MLTCKDCEYHYDSHTIHICPKVRIVIEQYPDMVWIVPNGTSIDTLNKAAAALLHWTAQQLAKQV